MPCLVDRDHSPDYRKGRLLPFAFDGVNGGHLLHDPDHGPHWEPEIRPIQLRRVEARDTAVEIERVWRTKAVAE